MWSLYVFLLPFVPLVRVNESMEVMGFARASSEFLAWLAGDKSCFSINLEISNCVMKTKAIREPTVLVYHTIEHSQAEPYSNQSNALRASRDHFYPFHRWGKWGSLLTHDKGRTGIQVCSSLGIYSAPCYPPSGTITQQVLPALCLKVATNIHFPDAMGFICSWTFTSSDSISVDR